MIPQLHIVSLIFVWLLKMGTLMCLSVYWHGSSCWSQHSVRITICTEQKVPQTVLWARKQHLPGHLLLSVSPGLSHPVHVPEPGSAGGQHLGYNNHTCWGAVGESKILLECWDIFGSPSWTSTLWEPHWRFWKGLWCPAVGLENWVLMSTLSLEIKESDSYKGKAKLCYLSLGLEVSRDTFPGSGMCSHFLP